MVQDKAILTMTDRYKVVGLYGLSIGETTLTFN